MVEPTQLKNMLVKLDHFPKIFGVKIKKLWNNLPSLLPQRSKTQSHPTKLLGDPDNTVASSGGPWSLSGGPRADRYKWSYEAPVNGLVHGWYFPPKQVELLAPKNWFLGPPCTKQFLRLLVREHSKNILQNPTTKTPCACPKNKKPTTFPTRKKTNFWTRAQIFTHRWSP